MPGSPVIQLPSAILWRCSVRKCATDLIEISARTIDLNREAAFFAPKSRFIIALLKATISLAFAVAPLAASAADLQVKVTDGPSVPSTLYIALFDTAEAFSSNQAVSSQKVEMLDGTAQLVFSGLPAGRYVIKSFADENGNAKLDTNIVGLPIERYGFSNNARGRIGPPTFDAAAVQLDVDSSITFQLR